MVLLDSSSPYQFTKIAAYPGQYAAMRRGLALLPTLARFGTGPAVPWPRPARPGGCPGPGDDLHDEGGPGTAATRSPSL